MKKIIDLRSDTVTRPTPAMREAMNAAKVGDDVFGDDPTVNLLEERMADLLGFEAGMLVTSGTQGNLVCLLTHCKRGEEYITGQHAHNYIHEGGGAAMFGGIQPQPLELLPDGTFDFSMVENSLKPDDNHYPRSRLLCIENTYNGLTLTEEYMARSRAFAQKHHLRLHLDGARLFNASVKLKIPVVRLARCADSVSVCLSKGLGAPVGSVVCGSRDFIKEARRYRKALGGGMRQAGILAAAGIYAIDNNIDRLAIDHANAILLAEGLRTIPAITVDNHPMQTNMVFFSMEKDLSEALATNLKKHDILILAGNPIRMVTHLDVDESDIGIVVDAVKKFFDNHHKY